MVVQEAGKRALVDVVRPKREPFQVRPWLFRIVKNLVADHFRTQPVDSLERTTEAVTRHWSDDYWSSGHPTFLEKNLVAFGGHEAARDPADILEGEERQARLRGVIATALSALPKEYVPLLMDRAEGLSYEASGAKHGLEAREVKRMLERARKIARPIVSEGLTDETE